MQKYRWKKKWSEEQLSRVSGVSRSVICKLENGVNQNPTAEVAFRLADALNVDVRELLLQRRRVKMVKGVKLKIKEYVDILGEGDEQFLIQIYILLRERLKRTGRL